MFTFCLVIDFDYGKKNFNLRIGAWFFVLYDSNSSISFFPIYTNKYSFLAHISDAGSSC